jgi:hypothetical protein
MATSYNPKIDTRGLAFYIDAANRKSFTSIQRGWGDMLNSRTASFTGAAYSAENSGAIAFDGNLGSSASIGQSFFYAGPRTFDAWFKRDQSINAYNIVWGYYVPYLAFRSNGEFHFSFYTRNSATNTQQSIYSGATFSDSVWHNVTCTIDYDYVATTSTAKIYVNGALARALTTDAGSATLPIVPNLADNKLTIGNWYGGSSQPYPFKGSISNIKIYDRLLSDSEILRNYSAHKSRFGHA